MTDPIATGAKPKSKSLILQNNIVFSSEDSVSFKSSSESIGAVCIGERTVVESNTIIENSSIGKDWEFSENCRVTESVIWNNVKIGAASEITNWIITDGIIIPPGSHFKNVVLVNVGSQDNQQLSEEPIEFSLGIKFADDGNETEESDLMEDESDEETTQANTHAFEDEIKAIIVRQITEEYSLDSIKVEINTVRFSDNKSLTECWGAVVTSLIDYVMSQKDQTIQTSIKSIDKLFNEFI